MPLAVIWGGLFGCASATSHADGEVRQGWSEADRRGWYDGTQGSRLIPFDWLVALEQPDNGQPFLATEHIERFRYLPRTDPSGRPMLPVGFALDDSDDSELTFTRLRWTTGQGSDARWVGMNCSACHTGEIAFEGRRLRIDGGATIADFQSFMETLDQALEATRAEPEKWERFAAAVLDGRDTDANRALLEGAFDDLLAWRRKVALMNETPLRYGYARLDAFGHIFNKAALLTNASDPIANPPDAPTSYPFLWNVHQHDKVQWNGIASNSGRTLWPSGETFDVGALGRNTGEVIGVFADVNVTRSPGLAGYDSSVQAASLDAMEDLITRLEPPAWPVDVFGELDDGLVAEGRALFEAQCQSCHLPLAHDDLTTRFQARMSFFRDDIPGNVPPGTDPWMACNAYTYEARTGDLEGIKRRYVFGERLGEQEPVANVLSALVAGTLVGKKGEIVSSAARAFFGIERRPRVVEEEFFLLDRAIVEIEDLDALRLERCMTEESDILGYKARPLTGIWATAPYLHNGSVPTLHDLLLPPDERPDTFFLGTREYDPVKVGYRTEQSAENSFRFQAQDEAGEPIPGNSNAGHDYGNAGLTEAQRRALVEYMKSL
ncbi:MAG TPA: di-heme-cytochrome C peroxidase [Geminicoccaceae bacterium]